MVTVGGLHLPQSHNSFTGGDLWEMCLYQIINQIKVIDKIHVRFCTDLWMPALHLT